MRPIAFALALVCSSVLAGPDDPSKFDGSALGAQKVVYHFNYEKPEDMLQGLGYLNNHTQGLKEFGSRRSPTSWWWPMATNCTCSRG